MGAYKQNPRYNHIQTRVSDGDFEYLQDFAKSNGVSIAKAASVLIASGVKLTQEANNG